ncbi:MAG: universal stress protein [Salinivirgaceae bacterium]|jgi:nucleotide-binding universal stress UspA family protein|nr:universal stress protein [Salinivirgaceae bacterium]
MENQLVTISTFSKMHVGCFVKEKFELEGIECFLTDEDIKTADNTPQGIKLKVRANDTEKAVQIIMQVHKESDLDKIELSGSIPNKKKILVLIDFSESLINACEYAFGIAKIADAEVKLLHVYEDPTLNRSGKNTTSWQAYEKIEAEQIFSKAQADMLSFSNELKKRIGSVMLENIKFHFALLKGNTEDVIEALGKRYKPDLIILGSEGRDENNSMFSGGITTKVIENTNFPVLTIPTSASFSGIGFLNIVYATDFNEADNSSLNNLLDIVAPFNTKIHCIHIDNKEDSLKQDKVAELNKFLKIEYPKYDIKCILLKNNDLVNGLEDYIDNNNNIDIISFSSPKRTLFHKIFYTNNLNRLVSTCKIPMLVFPV